MRHNDYKVKGQCPICGKNVLYPEIWHTRHNPKTNELNERPYYATCSHFHAVEAEYMIKVRNIRGG